MIKKRVLACATVLGMTLQFSAGAVSLQKVEEFSFPKEQTGAQYEISGEDTFEEGTYVGESYMVDVPIVFREVSFPNQGTVLWKNTWNDSGTTVTERVVHNYGVNYSHQFVRYVTNTWQKASQYSQTINQSVSWTVGSNLGVDIHDKARLGLNLQKTVTYSSGTTVFIPADPSRYSKLGFSSDFVGEYFYYDILHGSSLVSRTNDYFKAPVKGRQFLDVIYQS